MSDENLRLVQLTVEMRSAFLAMADEFRSAGDDRYQEAIDDFEAFVGKLDAYARGEQLQEGHVPATTFWLVRDDGTVLGRAGLRHRLTGALEHEGGHIGYGIRPSERRKGYGTRLLALALEKAREMGITRALVTCDTDNVASARIIEKNGGKLDSEVISHRSGKPVSRYWIDL